MDEVVGCQFLDVFFWDFCIEGEVEVVYGCLEWKLGEFDVFGKQGVFMFGYFVFD